jgi:DNA-binding response OmpR family regulator
MNHKVLLADDSLTIQKVIKITLANQPYDITDCSSEEELFKKLPQIKPEIVFLDFNLSENLTGYELSSKIKSICPSTKVLMLLGTFDSVDDSAMEKCGASDKIVKPFDSNKFIAICKRLVEEGEEESPEEDMEIETETDSSEEESPEDQWQMNHSTSQMVSEPKYEESKTSEFPLNALNKEMSEWGMSIPGVINDSTPSEKQIDLPPVIGEVKSLDKKRQSKFETKFPVNDDLDYPTIEEMQNSAEKEEAPAQSSKLISIEAFTEETVEEMEIQGSYVADEADISSIEAQIRDEVEKDLWKADEFEELKNELSTKIEEISGDEFRPNAAHFDESLFKPLNDEESLQFTEQSGPKADEEEEAPTSAQINLDSMRQEIEIMVKKYVKEYMDEMFKKNVEKISWEVIPDLAENLIRQELSKISSKIMDDQN